MLRSEQGQVNGSTGEPSQDGEGTTARSPSRDQLFRELVQQHNKRLYRFIFRHIGHSGDAEDLTQQAFVEAVRVYETYRGEAKLSTWLYGIAINLVRNHLNRSPERIYEFQGTEVLANLDSAALSVEDTVASHGGFVVKIARTGIAIPVGPGKSILHSLREAGVSTPSSCEEGICGACEVNVLGGVPEHRDAVLSEPERAANNRMMICCSGSRTPALVLDL